MRTELQQVLSSAASNLSETLKAARRSSSGVSTSSVLSVSSAALSQAISSIDNGKNAVVIEIGTKLTKLGCAGECTPRHIIRTEYVDENGEIVNSDEIFALNNQKTASNTMEHYEEILRKFLRLLFFKVLAPPDRPVVIVESVFMSEVLRNSITKIVLEKLRYKSLMFMPSHLCSTFPFNTQNALVVDLGYSECISMPVIEGVTMLNEFESARSICGKKLEKRVKELMKKFGRIEEMNGERRELTEDDWNNIETLKIIETIAIGVVCLNRSQAEKWRELENAENEKPENTIMKERTILLHGQNLIVPEIVLETSCEIFFDEELNQDSFDVSLPKLLLRIVKKCPIDLRTILLRNVMLTGGLALIPGLSHRLKEEIQHLATEDGQRYAETVQFYQFSNLKNLSLFASWLGASMLGSLRETVEKKSITLTEFHNGKLAANWTDFIMRETL